jgi:hypothetical protein
LNRRLSEEVRRAIVTAYQEGVRQQVLADRYEVSLSSIKRLIRASRLSTRPPTVRSDRAGSTAVDVAMARARNIALSSLNRPEGLVAFADIEPRLEVGKSIEVAVPNALVLVLPEL